MQLAFKRFNYLPDVEEGRKDDIQIIALFLFFSQITSFADGSNVYGSDLCEMRELREFQGGRLNTTKQFHGGKDLLPLTTENAECKAKSGFCFEAGDARNSEQPVLASIHTIFMRQHNTLADELSRLNPQWSDETLYQEAR